jgi:hypothetical protein
LKCLTGFEDIDYWEDGGGRLEKAHVIDRFAGGLDTLPNFRPLCPTCHRLQPMFVPGQEAEALAWFDDHRSPLIDIANAVLKDTGRRR